jgi:hypothetical protein
VLVPLTIQLLVGRFGAPSVVAELVNIFEGVDTVKKWVDNVRDLTSLPQPDLIILQKVLKENGLYLVESSDTLESIATELKDFTDIPITPQLLKEWNKLETYPDSGLAPDGQLVLGGIIRFGIKKSDFSPTPTDLPTSINKQGFLMDFTDGVLYTMGETPLTHVLADRSPEAVATNPTLTQLLELGAKYKSIGNNLALYAGIYKTPSLGFNDETIAAMGAVASESNVAAQLRLGGLMDGVDAYLPTNAAAVEQLNAMKQNYLDLASGAREMYVKATDAALPNLTNIQNAYRNTVTELVDGFARVVMATAVLSANDNRREVVKCKRAA